MESIKQEKISEMLQLFYRAFQIPVSLYLHEKPLVSYVSIAFEPDPALLFLKNAFLSEYEDTPDIFYASHHAVLCGMVRIHGMPQYILVGPVSSIPPTPLQCSDLLAALDLPFSRKRELLYWLKKTPLFNHGRFISLLKFIDYLINGSVGIPADINEVEITEEHKDYALKHEGIFHNTQELERDVLKAVEDGRREDLLNLISQIPVSGASMGIIAENNVRILKNIFITSAALVSRAAIRGGMDYDYALTLSDSYIQDMEKLKSEEEIPPLMGMMMVDYCEHIARLNKPDGCSPLTVAVLDDVVRHLHGTLTVADIAKRLHRSSSYISHLFEQEMHMPLKQYILQQKIKEAKRLLLADYSISDIAMQLGFSSQSHFQTTFKMVSGMSPGAFRKLLNES